MRGTRASAKLRTPRARYSWAEPLRRVFLIDVLLGANCGSRRTLLAAIHEPDGIRRILDQLGLPADPPELARARSPPEQWRPW